MSKTAEKETNQKKRSKLKPLWIILLALFAAALMMLAVNLVMNQSSCQLFLTPSIYPASYWDLSIP